MKMIKVKSSNIRSVGYSANLFQLVVEFKATDRSKAKIFTYEDVSPAEYDALINASSVGRHFGAYIKNVKEGRPINCTVVAGDNGEELHVKGKSKPTKSPWVSVDDGLPETSGAYWTFNGLEKQSVIQQRVHMYDAEYKHFNIDTVTHWMPLPEAPTT